MGTRTHRWVEGITSKNGMMQETQGGERERIGCRSKEGGGCRTAKSLSTFLTWWLFRLGLFTGLWVRTATQGKVSQRFLIGGDGRGRRFRGGVITVVAVIGLTQP